MPHKSSKPILSRQYRDFGFSTPQTTTSEIVLDKNLLAHPDQATIDQYLREKLGLRAPATDYHDDPDQIQVTYAAPGTRTLVTINREDGKAEVEKEKQIARERTAVDQRASDDLNKERAETVAGVTPSTYKQYERVRKARRGIGVAEALDGRCSACQIALRPQFFQQLRRGDTVMACEQCLRILYYNPPVKFEDLTGEPAPAAQQ